MLGHQNCGAVKAAVEAMADPNVREVPAISNLLKLIEPGLKGLNLRLPIENRIAAAVEANVRWSLRQLAEHPVARRFFAEKRCFLTGGVYELSADSSIFSTAECATPKVRKNVRRPHNQNEKSHGSFVCPFREVVERDGQRLSGQFRLLCSRTAIRDAEGIGLWCRRFVEPSAARRDPGLCQSDQGGGRSTLRREWSYRCSSNSRRVCSLMK